MTDLEKRSFPHLFSLFVVAATLVLTVSRTVDAFSLVHRSTRHSSTRLFASQDGSNKKIVVVGNGMVGQRFMENMLKIQDKAASECLEISTFCEEPRAAYNRVKLTSYFETRNPSALSMTEEFDESGSTPWYENNNVQLYLNDKVTSIDPKSQTLTSEQGRTVPYDICVLATGSVPFVPPIPGKQRPGVFVYRTIQDLENMLKYVKENQVKAAAVIGGGLLGLEAAKAAQDMGLESHIIEFADILVRLLAHFRHPKVLISNVLPLDVPSN
jgi:nitrite reductase (NADH) large subunit